MRLKDIFAPRRAPHDSYGSGSNVRPGAEGLGFGGKTVALHRLDRLQEVANLALEDREGLGGGWGCADIGAGACHPACGDFHVPAAQLFMHLGQKFSSTMLYTNRTIATSIKYFLRF